MRKETAERLIPAVGAILMCVGYVLALVGASTGARALALAGVALLVAGYVGAINA